MDPHNSSGFYHETPESKFVRDPFEEVRHPTEEFTYQPESKFVRDPFEEAERPLEEFAYHPESKFVRDPFIRAVPTTETIGDLHHSPEPTKFVNESAALENHQSAINFCKDTQFLRDECIINYGIEKCEDEISNHNACLRKEGYLHDLHET